ncbi:hypothetical protein O3M35_011451 [Rhynocoris fuscipes]|uniref:Uncharacterized protein n=1 Tax=Rhynocoris fuscipes TaxID=488301 RepID=A0AAW1CWA8_9HEMI
MKPYWPPGRNRRIKAWKHSSLWSKCKLYLSPFIKDFLLLRRQIPHPFIMKLIMLFGLIIMLIFPLLIIIFLAFLTVISFQLILNDSLLIQRYNVATSMQELFKTKITTEEDYLMYRIVRYYINKYIGLTSILLDIISMLREMYALML